MRFLHPTAKQLGRLHCHASRSQNLPCGFKFGREQKYRFNAHFFHCLRAWAVHVLGTACSPRHSEATQLRAIGLAAGIQLIVHERCAHVHLFFTSFF
jgi:hypothetical protein